MTIAMVKRRRKPDKRHLTEARKAQCRASYHRNVDKRKAYDRARYLNNEKRRDALKGKSGLWAKMNPGKANYITQRRRLRVRRATPLWLTVEHHAEIKALYIEAGDRDGDWHVDHIVPLAGKTVCGLNVPWNMQVLSGLENRKKSNSWE